MYIIQLVYSSHMEIFCNDLFIAGCGGCIVKLEYQRRFSLGLIVVKVRSWPWLSFIGIILSYNPCTFGIYMCTG